MSTVTLKNPRHRLNSVDRHGGWLPDRPNVQDWSLEKKLGDAIKAAVPENPFLDPNSYPVIRDQGNQGSCTGHGTRNALMQRLLLRDHKLWTKYDLSPASAYLNGRVLEQAVYEDSGCYIRDVIKGAGDNGVAREDYAPYSDKRLTVSLSKQAKESARWHQAISYYRCDENNASPEQTVDNVIRALGAGMPVIFGFTCFSNLGAAEDTGYIAMPGSRDREEGGHCMTIYEANTSRREFTGPNSWGPWGAKGRDGQRGYFRLPFDYVLQGLADDFWAVDHE
jgi:C1A family cysteine protease